MFPHYPVLPSSPVANDDASYPTANPVPADSGNVLYHLTKIFAVLPDSYVQQSFFNVAMSSHLWGFIVETNPHFSLKVVYNWGVGDYDLDR